MRYYRVISGPSEVTVEGHTVVYFTIRFESVAIEEKDAPVLMTEYNLADAARLKLDKMFRAIYIYFDNKTYEYRTQLLVGGSRGDRILIETDRGY